MSKSSTQARQVSIKQYFVDISDRIASAWKRRFAPPRPCSTCRSGSSYRCSSGPTSGTRRTSGSRSGATSSSSPSVCSPDPPRSSFWEAGVTVGRVYHQRSSIFLNHWLIERTGSEVVAREVFARFKRFADHEAGVPMATLLEQIHAAATVYRKSIGGEHLLTGPLDRIGLFVYRTGVMESEVVKPFLLYLLDPQEAPIPAPQLHKALESVESWMVRRMLVRATTKAYNNIIVELITKVRDAGRAEAGDVVERFLADSERRQPLLARRRGVANRPPH